MRTITNHAVNPANEQLKIEVIDEPGSGGANHKYVISGMDQTNNHSYPLIHPYAYYASTCILFQNGPIPEKGVNGITHEALLAIVEDRLASFQAGPYACEENGRALWHVRAALAALKERTMKRMARGVEGTHKL